MEETSRSVLDVLRSDGKVNWVAVELVDSFTEGIAESAKERSASFFQEPLVVANIGAVSRERTKREKYETSRPYTEEEKIALIEEALKQVFVVVPEMQIATAEALKDLGARTTVIEFLAPDNEEREEGSYERSSPPTREGVEGVKRRLDTFCRALKA